MKRLIDFFKTIKGIYAVFALGSILLLFVNLISLFESPKMLWAMIVAGVIGFGVPYLENKKQPKASSVKNNLSTDKSKTSNTLNKLSALNSTHTEAFDNEHEKENYIKASKIDAKYPGYINARFLEWYSYNDWKQISVVNDFPMWMKYECGISQPLLKHNEMLKNGYIMPSEKAEALNAFRVEDIREFAKSQNLPTKGKKADIINIICTQGDLSAINTLPCFKLTEKGRLFISEHSELLQACKFHIYDISLDDYYNAKEGMPFKCHPNDIAWSILNKRTLQYTQSKSFGLLRNTYLSMAKICEAEHKNSQALKFYCALLRYDLSGLGNNNSYDYSEIILAPGIIKSIAGYKEYFNEEAIITFCEKLYIPRSMTSISTFKEILNDIFNDELKDIGYYIPIHLRVERHFPTEEELDEQYNKLADEIGADMPFDEWRINKQK